MDHETTKNINDQFLFLDKVLSELPTSNNIILNKMLMVRNRMVQYFQSHYNEIETSSDNNSYLYLCFSIGMLSGIASYYTQHKNLTKDHIGDLNKIYKKYKVTK